LIFLSIPGGVGKSRMGWFRFDFHLAITPAMRNGLAKKLCNMHTGNRQPKLLQQIQNVTDCVLLSLAARMKNKPQFVG